MIVDIDKVSPLPLASHYDVCIAGGGVAGITLALRLAAKKKRVLLLEAGGTDYSDASQAVYRGRNVGYAYHELEFARLRYLGGTSGHWNGMCRALDEHDFLPRDHIPDSGWPIRKSDIDPYQDEARNILELEPFPDHYELPDSNGKLQHIGFSYSPPVRFGEKYRQPLTDSKEIDVFLNANLVEAGIEPGNGQVTHFGFRGYADNGPLHKASADRYVLALGGIENARFLLTQGDKGLANETDMVGRYFMEHLEFEIGNYVATPKRQKYTDKAEWIIPTPALMNEKKITNAGLRLSRIVDTGSWSYKERGKLAIMRGVCASDLISDWVSTVYPHKCNLPIDDMGSIEISTEQIPNPKSRVLLGDDKDRFGLRRSALDWQPTEFDKNSMRNCAMELGRYFAREGYGRVKLRDWLLTEDASLPTDRFGEHYVGGFHHMGTTRMAESAKDGIVDKDCRVFGHDNFYIAGSSVFRTAGQANPTFTIVQLALRLGDHLIAADA